MSPESDPPLFGPVNGDVGRLEWRLRASLEEDDPAAAWPVADLFAAGGTRLRPALVLLSAHLGQYDLQRLEPAAMAVELLHAATLIHDDVIDRSDVRRGRPTVAAAEGPEAAIVIGDHAFAKAYREASQTGDAAVVTELAEAMMRICAGELEQNAARWQWKPSREAYLRRIEGKTAVLLSAACRVGARLGGLDREAVDALGRYGTQLGLAFQIADDVLDYIGTEAELGKPVGHDLIEGMATLPLMLTPAALELLAEGVAVDSVTAARVVDAVRSGPGPDAALEEAEQAAAQGVAELARFGDAAAAQALAAIATYVVARKL